jgi:hypothetical protein
MPRVRFEPTIPVYERPTTFHALDREAIVIGIRKHHLLYSNLKQKETDQIGICLIPSSE